MSVDVSPNGKTLVFDLLGDLYTLSINGGLAQPLTTGPAWDGEPRFSPDGRLVAFISDRTGIANLWVMHSDGSGARQLSALARNVSDSPISSPAWAPDGRTIVVSQRLGALANLGSWGAAQRDSHRWLLAAYDVATGEMRWVADSTVGETRRVTGPAFAVDGTTIYAAVEGFGSARRPGPMTWHIARVDLLSGRISPEMAPWLGRIGARPVVSPDGRLLCYVSTSGSRFGLRLRSLRTFEERWLVREQLDSPSMWDAGASGETRGLSPGYAFTPNSDAIIIAFDGKIHRIDVVTGRERVIPFVVDVEQRLAPMQVHHHAIPDTAVRTRSVMQAALSPDGRAVAFSALDRLWVMTLSSDAVPLGTPRRMTSDSFGEFYPSWSPDGSWVAYSSWRDGEGGAVRRVWLERESTKVPRPTEPLTVDTAMYFGTAVAQDGMRVVAVRADMAPERILTFSSGDPVIGARLVSIPATDRASATINLRIPTVARGGRSTADHLLEQMHFSGSSSRIRIGLSSRARDGADERTDLVLMDAGSGSRRADAASGVLSPDGRRALVVHRFALFEVTLPAKRHDGPDTLNIEEAQKRPFGAESGSALRWGRALRPWISWSRDGRRVLFVQAGTLFLGDVPNRGWISFRRIDVPLPVPADGPRGTLVLRGGSVITMRRRDSGRAEVIPRGDVIVQNNRLFAIGPTGSLPIPAGAEVFDVSGKTLLPGYVDVHDHLGYPYGIHPGQAWPFLVRLAHGVTASRDPYASQAEYGDVFAYRERERAGDLIGPRVFSSGIVHFSSDQPIQTIDDARALVHPSSEYFASETFKEYSSDPWPSRRLIATAAAEAGLNATVHGDPLRAILDGFSAIEHNIAIPIYDDVLTLIARSGVTHTQTFSVTAGGNGYWFSTGREPWAFAQMRRFVPLRIREARTQSWLANDVSYFGHPDLSQLRSLLRTPAGIVNRGGRVAMGMHGNIPGVGFHYELWLHALGGMSNHEILRSATIAGATAIGHAGDFGSLEAGKLADLQVLDHSPLTDIHNTTSIRYVMKNGRLYRSDDLTEIWPRWRPLASVYLWNDSMPTTRAIGSSSTPAEAAGASSRGECSRTVTSQSWSGCLSARARMRTRLPVRR